jgi:hypothetical protein
MIAETTAVSKTALRVPESMRAARRWILWRPGKWKNGKREKKPVFRYNATKPETWMTFEQALREAEIQNAFLGFVLGDGFIGFDLDGCIAEDGTLSEAALDLLKLGTYVEESPGKEGLHAIACVTIPRSHKLPGFEVYDGAPGHARWFTVTGAAVGDVREVAFGPELQARVDAFYKKWFARSPEPKRELPKTFSDDEIVELLRSYKNGAKFQDLLNGGLGDSRSASEADLAFLRMTRFVTRDRAQLDRLFRQSGRMRKKWDEPRGSSTWGEERIALAISMGGKVYTPRIGAKSFREQDVRIPFWWALRINGYGEAAMRVLIYLAAHADAEGACFPSRPTIAKDLGIHVDTWDDAIYTLKGFGILRSSQRYNDSNMYTLRYSLTPGEPIELPDSKKPLRIKERKSQKSITRRVFS